MLKYDETPINTSKVSKVKLNCFSNSGSYISTHYSDKITGNIMLNNSILIKIRKENPNLNIEGLSQLLKLPANLINKVLTLGGTLYQSISKNSGNNYFIFVQGEQS